MVIYKFDMKERYKTVSNAGDGSIINLERRRLYFDQVKNGDGDRLSFDLFPSKFEKKEDSKFRMFVRPKAAKRLFGVKKGFLGETFITELNDSEENWRQRAKDRSHGLEVIDKLFLEAPKHADKTLNRLVPKHDCMIQIKDGEIFLILVYNKEVEKELRDGAPIVKSKDIAVDLGVKYPFVGHVDIYNESEIHVKSSRLLDGERDTNSRERRREGETYVNLLLFLLLLFQLV